MIGAIINRFESNGLTIVGIKMLPLTSEQAEGFYAEQKEKSFFESLVNLIISSPIIVQVLDSKDAIRRNSAIIGKTNPINAHAGTLRANYADNCT